MKKHLPTGFELFNMIMAAIISGAILSVVVYACWATFTHSVPCF